MDPDDVRMIACCAVVVTFIVLGVLGFHNAAGWFLAALVGVACVVFLVLAVRTAVEVRRSLKAVPPQAWSTSADTDDPPEEQTPVAPDWMLRLYEGKTCPLCEAPIEAPSPFAQCPDCRQWYHETCWQEFGGCVKEGCPGAPGKLAPRRRAARPGVPSQQVAVARAIHNVGFCPYCQTPVEAGAKYVTCPACKTPYHSDCWQENNGCAVYGCAVRINR